MISAQNIIHIFYFTKHILHTIIGIVLEVLFKKFEV